MTPNNNMYVVVGSGPAGVMCAAALADKGLPVTLVDGGRECEAERLEVVRRLAAQLPDQWAPELRQALEQSADSGERIPWKRVFGSTFPYAFDELSTISQDNAKCVMSLAKGGLTNVWGAAMLPNPASDFARWPVSLEEMQPAYGKVADIVGIAGRHDDLVAEFPFFADPVTPPPLSRQAHSILGRLESNRLLLRRRGITFGQARLALRTQDNAEGKSCQRCGLCLSGCPYGSIYNTCTTLAQLQRRKLFTYRPGLIVRQVGEDGEGSAFVRCERQDGTGEERLEGKRVFLACGTLSTTCILINSVTSCPDRLTIRFQPYFLLPLISLTNSPRVEDEQLHTLAQIFIEVEDSEISPEVVHLQLYTYNSLIRQRLEALTRRVKVVREVTRRHLLGRLLAVQGYLSGTTSHEIQVEVPPIRQGKVKRGIRLSASLPETTIGAIAKLVRKLCRNAWCIGTVPFPPMLEVGVPGDGNHIGGVFPMRRMPRDWETDRVGRMPFFRRIHLVDGTVLPSLPATTITYTIMANAYRIGTEVGAVDLGSGGRL